MSTRFYYGQQDYIIQLNAMDDIATASASSAAAYAQQALDAKTAAEAAAATATGGQVNSDWNATTGKAQILNKPVLAAVATTGSKADVGLGNVENKSSATIRGEITSANVTGALTYTPVNKAGDHVLGRLGMNQALFGPAALNSPANGHWNPLATALAGSKCLHEDEEFAIGVNAVGLYNNAGGTAVSITRTADSTAPNSSGYVIAIANNGGAASPGLGGFVQNIPHALNKIFVQRFRAKIPVGYSVMNAENSPGVNNNIYWLTSRDGTGKYEDYIRVTHCGDSGTFSSGGHVYLTGPAGAVTWYLASCTAFEVTAKQKVWTATNLTNLSQLTNGPGFITASSSITGNAATATKLAAAVTINGVSFDGSSNITIPVGNNGEPVITAGTTAQYWRGDKSWQTLNATAVGLGNVNNTSDASKPISTATQTALDGKQATIATGTTSQYYRGDKAWATLDKTAVGLGNVDNTTDAAKPISTATQTALDGKQATITAGTTSQYYRGDKSWQTLNASAVGLGNVNNTSDASKPVSTATQTALDLKANLASPSFTGTVTMAGPALVNGATGAYSGFSPAMTINYTGSSSQYGIVLKPNGSTANTNAITFLKSSSTYTSATTNGVIVHRSGDAGMDLQGDWYYKGGRLPVQVNIPNGTNIDDVAYQYPGMYRFNDAGNGKPAWSYGNFLTINGGGDTYGQIVVDYTNGGIQFRGGVVGGTINPWRTVLHDANFGIVADRYNRWTGEQQFTTGIGTGVGLMTQWQACKLQAFSENGAAAGISFHRSGNQAINMGLDIDGHFKLGGWSYNTTYFWVNINNGDFTAYGNIIAYSDERLKRNWKTLPDNFLEDWSKVRVGIFERTDHDDGVEHVGGVAQDVQKILPQATPMQGNGYLGMNYSASAFVASVKLAEKVVEQDKLIGQLIARIEKLEKQ